MKANVRTIGTQTSKPVTSVCFFLSGLIASMAVWLAVSGWTGTANAQWTPEKQLSRGWGNVWAHAIAASGNTVHMIWGTDPIRYRRSIDEGATWSADTTLVSAGEPHLTDPLVAEGQNVYAVYLKNITTVTDWCCPRSIGDLYLRRSSDGGLTWQPETRLTTAGGAYRVSLAASESRLDMVWMDYRSGTAEVYYRRSLDGGAMWQPEVRLVAAVTGSVGLQRPQAASTGTSVHVVWGDDRDGSPPCYTMPRCAETYYKRSLDGGQTWGPDTRLTFGGTRFAGRPEIAVASPNTVIVNYNQTPDVSDVTNSEMYIMRSTDNGSTWMPETRLSVAPGDSDHGSMIAAGSAIHLAWHDTRTTGNREIYYRASSDGGATWDPEERITNTAGDSTTPLLAVTPNYAHVVWLDSRRGSHQVWYRRRSLAP